MTFGMCWDVFGSTVGMFSDGFGRGWGKSVEEVEKISFFKKVWEYFSRIGLPLTSILGLFPEENIR